MKKRILSLILCACLVLSICPALDIAPLTEVHAADSVTHTFDVTVDVTKGSDKDVIAAGTTYAEGYFTVVGTVTQRVKSSGVYAVELAKQNGGSIQFTTTATSTVTFAVASTGGSNESGYLLYRVDDSSTITSGTVTGTTFEEVVVENLSAGTYQLQSYQQNRATRVESITVVETVSSGGDTTCEHTYDADGVSYSWEQDENDAWKCTASRTCNKDCGYTDTADGTVTAGTDSATCTAAGEITYTATFEDTTTWGTSTKTVATLAAGHSWNDGVCSVCDAVCEHDWSDQNGICKECGLNCTHDSYGDDAVCDTCGFDSSCAHTNKNAVAEKAATCQATGNDAYWYCTDCGKYFSDEACTSETSLENVTRDIDDVNGHSWGEGTVETKATCQAEGVMSYTCSLCGETKTEAIAVDDTAHTWVDGEILIAASCIAEGKKQQTCDCGATQEVDIPAGHSYVEGVCAYHGTVLLDCTAAAGSKYIHNITTDGMTDADGFFTIAGDQDSTDLDTVIYNGETLTSAIKMNTKLNISFTVPTNEAEGDDYDGIMILVGSESRMKADGKTFIITTLKIAVSDGTTTTEYTIAVPSDGIIMFAVTNGYTYTITKVDGENPLYYFEYVPGANLASVTDSETGGESGGESGGEDDTTTGDGFVTFVAEIGGVQYLSLDAAVKAAKPGDTICLLKDTTETATIGDVLAVGESITIHLHGFTTGTITPDEGCSSAKSENADDGTDVITITRTEAAHEHVYDAGVVTKEPTCTEPGEMTYTCTIDGCTDSYTEEIPATGIHVDENGDGMCDHGCGTDMSYVAYIDADNDKTWDEGTETAYKTLEEALEAAGDAATDAANVYVRLLVDTLEEKYVIIPVGVVLDIEANTLTADYVVGFNESYLIADYYSADAATTPYGKLFVKKDIVLGETAYNDGTREILPWWNPTEECYVFGRLGIWNDFVYHQLTMGTDETSGDPMIKFAFMYKSEQQINNAFLIDDLGADDNKLTFIVRLSWTNDLGDAYQDFVYNAVLVKDVADGGQYFTFTLTNYEQLSIDLATLEVKAMIISDTGVVAVGDSCTISTDTDSGTT